MTPLSIAIVGVGALFPGRLGTDGFWRDILDRRDAIRDVPPTHWLIEDYYDPDPSAADKTYCKRGGFLDPVPFSPIELGLPPVALPSTDTAQILALVVARQVLAEASRATAGGPDRSRTSVILGVASTTELVAHYAGRLARPAWIRSLREAGLPETRVQEIADRISSKFVPFTEASFPGLLGNVVAGRIANRLDLGGSNYVTDAACASSLSALQCAIRELRAGDSDLVITGGVDALNDILMYMCFSKTPAFSPSGDCRPFSDRADGTLIGEGVGMVALRRLEDAERDGNRIYAVVRGIGSSSDGQATAVYAPRSEGQALALRRAYAQAGYPPSTVELVEAHGTGTIAGDTAEVGSLRSVFGKEVPAGSAWCALGSVKSQIGHTKAAAGSAGLIKTVLALHHKILPATIKVDRPNPALKLATSPFYLNTQTRPWIRRGDHPRRASVSSFGFGGSNFHVTLEEYTGPHAADRIRHMPAELVLLSAASSEALADRVRALASADLPPGSLAQTAMDAAASFSPADAYRLAIVAADERELRSRLDAALRRLTDASQPGPPPAGVYLGTGSSFDGRIAFLFPGQGSQYVNMGADVAMAFEVCRQAWDTAAAIDGDGGVPLHRIVFPPPAFGDDERAAQESRVTAQQHAQPAIGAVSLAHLALLSAVGLRADYALGHSFGEVMALHAAGACDAEQALAIAAKRGRLMADTSAGRGGAMIAVPLSREAVERHLAAWNSDLVVANDNAPQQVIVSGASASIGAAVAAFAEQGVTCVRLPVASAFHSPIVGDSAAPFEQWLAAQTFQPLAIPVVANSTAAPYPSDPRDQRALLAGQLARPVRFRESIERLHAEGVRLFVEVGPGRVLTRLVSQTLGDRPHHAIALDRRGANGVVEWLQALGALAALGLDLDYMWLFRETPPRKSDAPTRTPATRDVLGSNYGKPYPPIDGSAARPRLETSNPSMSETPSQHQPPPLPLESASSPAMTPVADSDVALLMAQIAETHRTFQQNMAAAHQSFLGMVERVLTGATSAPLPPSVMAPPPAATWAPPVPSGTWTPSAPTDENLAPSPATSPVQPPAAMPEARTPAPRPASARDVLLGIVSEKTGYPIDMLDLDMEIEANLGIDSIKQVEILSAFREQRPDLPAIGPQELATLRTLRAIIGFADTASGPGTQEPPASAGAPTGSVQTTAPAASTRDTLLAIVSEKTGYPIDMLDLDMEIEANLGIDSIKQVEILSAFRERRPDLPEISPNELATLRTLRAIVSFAERSGTPRSADRQNAVEQSRENVQAAAAPSPASVARYILDLVPAPPAGMSMPGLISGAAIAVTGGSDAVREAVVRALRQRGVDAAAMSAPDERTYGIVHLGVVDVPGPHDATALLKAALAQARTLSARLEDGEGVFVTVQDTGGTFGLESDPGAAAWTAGLPALVKTLAQECPKASVKAIDVARGDRPLTALADAIADELLHGGPEHEVGLPAPGRRVTVVSREAPLVAGSRPRVLADGQVVVVSGGARGVTAHAVAALAREARLRLVLLGRTRQVDEDPFPEIADEATLRGAFARRARAMNESAQPGEIGERVARLLAWREMSATIAALAASGSEVRSIPIDVRDRRAVAEALAEVRRDWGPIAGLIHGAGVLADKRLRDKTDAQIDRVVGTKLDGLAALLDATREDPLAWICLFSSAAARTGNVGQTDYATANEALNKVAQAEARRRPGCVVKSIGWGPWNGGMVTPALSRQFAERGIPLIDLDAGAAFLVRELTSGDRSVEVLAGCGSLDAGRTWSAEVEVSAATHPYLKDHVVRDRPVVPTVLLVEWALRLARAIDPSGTEREIRDLKVVRPLALVDFSEGGVARFIVTGTMDAGMPSILNVAITDRERKVHCLAVVDLRPAPHVSTPGAAWNPANAARWPWTLRELYDGPLFHGPDFHVIRTLDAVSDSGAACTVVGFQEQGWRGSHWVTDAAALDGGLQLAAAWGAHQTGQHFLPTRVKRVRWMSERSVDGPLRCILAGELDGHGKMVTELTLTGADGRLVAVIDGLEMYSVEAAAIAQ